MGLRGLRGLDVVVGDRAVLGPAFAQGDHLGPKSGVRGKHSVIAMAMDTWWRKQSRQPLEQLHGRQDEDAPPVGCRTGEPVDESGIRRSQRLDTVVRKAVRAGEELTCDYRQFDLDARSDGFASATAASITPSAL